MKIIFSSNSCWNIYNFRLNLLEELTRQGHTIYIIAKKDEYNKKLQKYGCKIFYVNIKRNPFSILFDLFYIFKLLYIFLLVRPDIYMGFTAKPNIYGSIIAHFFCKKIFCTVTGLGTGFLKGKFISNFFLFLYRLSKSKKNTLIFQNRSDLNLFCRKKVVSNLNCKIIQGSGVDIDFFKSKQNYINETNNNLSFLYVGRIIKQKGINELIKAIKKIKEENKKINANFIFLGDFDNSNISNIKEHTLLEWVNKNYIIHKNYTEDIRSYYEKCDCLILPSYREGLSKSILESCSMSKPVITTDVPGCRDIIENNYNGLLCKPYDYLDLYNKILEFIDLDKNTKKKMGKNARLKVEKNFSSQIIIKKYIDLLNL